MKSFVTALPPSGGYFDVPQLKKEVAALEQEMVEPNFWSDQERAREKSQRLAELRKDVDACESIDREVREISDLYTVAKTEGNTEITEELERTGTEIEKRIAALEFRLLFSEPYDERDVILAVHAGAGGTEAQDWAEMLLRMFFRFAERKEYTVQMLDESRGGEAGIKSATIRIRGRYAYGTFKSEHGVHRLVRISPFDAEQMRHTSFALVEVLPELEEIPEVTIDPKDLRIDTFLSSGHGGQSVQTTYSAVRIVHIPTGITATCQNERSQQQNKETALSILKAKLHKKYLEERAAEKAKLRGDYASAEWGNQIRSYVLHPYKLVKDHRTKHETADAEGVLDGALDEFVEAYLRWRAELK